MQYTSNPREYSAGGLGYPAILYKTSSTSLIAFNPREDPLAQAIVPHNNPVSHLHITRYFTGTNFTQSLMLRQEVVVATLAKTAFIEYPPKLLVNFIRGV